MRSLDELTLYANGLLEPAEESDVKRHVAECATCEDLVSRLRAERKLLLRAADRDATAAPAAEFLATFTQSKVRRPRTKLTLLGAAAAAVMLSALAWLLWRGPEATDSQPATDERLSPSLEETLDRLIAALKSPAADQRDIAVEALRRHGTVAFEKLENAKVDRRLIDACRGISPQDRALMDNLDRIKITVEFTDRPLLDAVDRVREASGLNFHVLLPELSQFPEQILITMKHKDYPLSDVLRGLHGALQPFAREKLIPVHAKDGIVLIGAKEPEPQSFAPIRPPTPPTLAKSRVIALGSAGAAERERIEAELRDLGFAAEPALWEGFRSPNPLVRAQVAELLRKLYLGQQDRPLARPPGPLDQRLSLDAESLPTIDILRKIVEPCGLGLVFECGPDEKNQTATFKVQQITARNCLKLFLPHRGMDFVELGTLLYVFTSNRVRALERTPRWAPLDEAMGIERWVEKVASGATREEADRGLTVSPDIAILLDALFQAGEALPGEPGKRCRAMLRQLLEEHRTWALNVPSGAELQALSPAQKAVLATKVTLSATDTLRAHLGKVDAIVDVREERMAKMIVSVNAVPLETLLKVMTRPHGLDFGFDGPTLVIDTAEKIRALVEKK